MKIIATLLLLFLPILHAGEVYESLSYGDSRDQVTKKLLECPRVECTVPKTMLSRVGLNGTFKLKNNLGDLTFSLFFDWTDSDGLKEITLTSDAIDPSAYQTKLKQHFAKALDLTTKTYGAPVMNNGLPKQTAIELDGILNTCLWKLDEGSLLLGIAYTADGYHISIRYTQQEIQAQPK